MLRQDWVGWGLALLRDEEGVAVVLVVLAVQLRFPALVLNQRYGGRIFTMARQIAALRFDGGRGGAVLKANAKCISVGTRPAESA